MSSVTAEVDQADALSGGRVVVLSEDEE